MKRLMTLLGLMLLAGLVAGTFVHGIEGKKVTRPALEEALNAAEGK